MSLRHRFLVMLVLAVVGIVAAGWAGFQLHSQSSAVVEGRAQDDADAAVERLAQGALSHRAAGGNLDDVTSADTKPTFVAMATQVIAPLFEAAAGFCDTDGTILLTVRGASRFDWPDASGRPRAIAGEGHADPPAPLRKPSSDVAFDPSSGRSMRPALLPADRDALIAACREATAQKIGRKRVSLPHDLLLFSLRGASDRLIAWTLIRLPPADSVQFGARWYGALGVVGVVTLAFVFVALDALVALRRGAAELRSGLSLLQKDLRAQIPLPRIRELNRVAIGLREMASHLAETQARERALAARLGHEQNLAALGRVAAGVAHEVRNPLTGIKLTLDNMSRRELDERSAKDVGTCREEIARLDRVVSSLLLVARKGPLEVSTFDAAALVDERIRVAEALARERGVLLERDGHVSITANRDALTRVVDNLLRNGIEASDAGQAVRIELRRDHGETQIRVVDRGPGVANDRVSQLFEPFFTMKPEGTGLGLFVSRSLLEAQGGALSYDRREGMTYFCAALPTEGRA